MNIGMLCLLTGPLSRLDQDIERAVLLPSKVWQGALCVLYSSQHACILKYRKSPQDRESRGDRSANLRFCAAQPFLDWCEWLT
jgi:hypothetical protein